MKESNGFSIGIDCDVDKSGVAVLKEGVLSLHSLRFFDLFDFLNINKHQITMIYIEAGWMNAKSNFRNVKGAGINAKIGSKVGANHETGKKVVEMCEYLNIPYTEVKPLKKIWRGPEGKITHNEFNKQAKTSFKRTNQEERDAGLILITR